jgi:hypothetical protein
MLRFSGWQLLQFLAELGSELMELVDNLWDVFAACIFYGIGVSLRFRHPIQDCLEVAH